MSTYQVSGNTLTISNDSGSGNILVTESINPITGGSGVLVVKMTNTSTVDDTIAQWQNLSTSYTYSNITPSTSTSFEGTNATFDVISTSTIDNGNYVYTVTLNNTGINYAISDELTILGSVLGGTNVTNDLVITVTDVSIDGNITDFTYSGNSYWPQSYVGSLPILPTSTEFVQISSGNEPAGMYFFSSGDTGSLLIQPVTIVTN